MKYCNLVIPGKSSALSTNIMHVGTVLSLQVLTDWIQPHWGPLGTRLKVCAGFGL